MIYKQLGYILLAASASASFLRIQGGSCNGLKSHDSCMAASEDGEACSWCESAAVDDACYKESDAKSLPSSVFFCEYTAAYGVKGSSCNGLKSHDSCMAASEDGEACSWCESAAVDDACYKESDAKSLPSSVFFCEYAPVSLLDMGSKYLAKVVDIVFGWGK